jgi:predicted Zn-ribbon and HTH transcriptional regulator
LCGYEFDKEEAIDACKNCPTIMSGSCNFIKCPNCGFEIAAESKLLKLLGKLRRSKN